MCKRLLTVFAVAWGTLSLSAGPRSTAEAEQLAAQFFEKHAMKARGAVQPGSVALAATSADLSTASRTVRQASVPAYYVYNQADNGFVIISGDDRMPDVLGYSFEGEFALSEVPDNMRAWLQLYELKRDELDVPGAAVEPLSVPAADEGLAPSVEPLLGDINYNQNDPYNRKCPTVNGQRCVTGCVATAMAQVMRYYKYPEKGTRVKGYTTQTHGIQLTYNYVRTTFDWDNMLPAYTSGQYNATEADAVAELMLACGVAASMNYTPSESGAVTTTALAGMMDYLSYNPYAYMASAFCYSLEEWQNLIKSELSARRPVLFSAADEVPSGHAFVIDGYDETGLFHINWGWSGSSNGYYLVTKLKPGVSGIGGSDGSGYQFEQMMAVGLAPSTQLSEVRSYFEMGRLDIDAQNLKATANAIYNRANEFTGRMAIIADLNGEQKPISNIVSLSGLAITYGYTSYGFNLNVPAGMADGVYEVYVGTRLNEGRTWDRVRTEYGISPEYFLVVENGKARFVEEDDGTIVPEITVTPAGELHSNRSELFTIVIKNPRPEHEFTGRIELAVLDENQNQLKSQRIEQVYVGPGETDTIVCAVKMPEYVGKAFIRPIWMYSYTNHYVGEPLEVTIGEQGTPARVVRAIRCKLADSRVATGSNIVCTGQIGISGAGDYFDGSLVAYLYRNGSSSAAVQTQRFPVNLQKGEVQDFSVTLNADVTPGSYSFRLYAYDASKSSPLTQLWTSSVLVTVIVGIPSVESGDGLQIEVEKGASVVSLTSDQPMRSVHLYSAQGALLRQATLSGSDRAYNLDVADLSAGTYIVQVTLADGTVQQAKFAR